MIFEEYRVRFHYPFISEKSQNGRAQHRTPLRGLASCGSMTLDWSSAIDRRGSPPRPIGQAEGPRCTRSDALPLREEAEVARNMATYIANAGLSSFMRACRPFQHLHFDFSRVSILRRAEPCRLGSDAPSTPVVDPRREDGKADAASEAQARARIASLPKAYDISSPPRSGGKSQEEDSP
jgi:hypothetical protein